MQFVNIYAIVFLNLSFILQVIIVKVLLLQVSPLIGFGGMPIPLN